MTMDNNDKPVIKKLGDKFKSMRQNSMPLSMTSPNRYTHWILWATLGFIVIFLIWAKFAVLEEVTVAEGTVIPLTHVQSIQNMEGGIIKEISVHENDIVNKGQVLAVLDPTRFQSALNEADSRQAALQIQIARLNAEIQNVPFVVDMKLQREYPSLYQTEMQLYKSRQQQLTEMRNNYDLAQKELNMTKPVVSEGAAAEVDVLHLQRQALSLKSQLDDFYSHALDDLNTAKSNLGTLQASMVELQDRVTRTTLRSPVRGIVKEIRTPSTGGVVLPGMEIMTIIPLEDSLLVEAEVKPSQIGFVKIGAQAMVKITAYDYSVYGGLQGVVKQVSADTIKNPEGRSFYLVRIKTDRNYLRTPQDPLYIIPGMTASVDILTGKRTVLDYILTPLVKAQENALRER